MEISWNLVSPKKWEPWLKLWEFKYSCICGHTFVWRLYSRSLKQAIVAASRLIQIKYNRSSFATVTFSLQQEKHQNIPKLLRGINFVGYCKNWSVTSEVLLTKYDLVLKQKVLFLFHQPHKCSPCTLVHLPLDSRMVLLSTVYNVGHWSSCEPKSLSLVHT